MGIFSKQSGTKSQFTTATVVAKGCTINGDLQLACDIQVDGFVDGKLRTGQSLIVSQDGRLKGEIIADKVVVNGLIEGTCHANAIEILENGKVQGTIFCDNLSIEKGGQFLGETYAAQKEQVVAINGDTKRDTKRDADLAKEKNTAKIKAAN